ncbi:MAG TPA: hypothetical protein VGH33_07895, partial [Isosphaeraceae bacterium]
MDRQIDDGPTGQVGVQDEPAVDGRDRTGGDVGQDRPGDRAGIVGRVTPVSDLCQPGTQARAGQERERDRA